MGLGGMAQASPETLWASVIPVWQHSQTAAVTLSDALAYDTSTMAKAGT
jgi:hypothetical protein